MFKETKTIIHSDKISNDIRLLVFSDIHYSSYKDFRKLKRIYEKVKLYDVKYICIPGDLIDNNDILDKDYFINWIERLSKLCIVILSLGNHDIRKKRGKKGYIGYRDTLFLKKLSSINNVYLLDNNYIEFDDIYFYGYTQSFNYYYSYKRENSNLMKEEIDEYKVCKDLPNKYNVLLMHSPVCLNKEDIKSKLDIYDLILTGHMHNGMVPPILDDIVKNNIGIISPNKELFPDNARGIKKDNNIVVISSGITKLSKNTGKFMSKLNIIFPIGINYIIITNKDKEFKNSCKYYI